MTVYTVLMDFAFASILILVGQLLRAKVPLIQKFFIPSSMLAGFLGLFLGPQFLNVLHFSDSISSYTSVLMIPIFAAIGINGFKIDKQTMRNEASACWATAFIRPLRAHFSGGCPACCASP